MVREVEVEAVTEAMRKHSVSSEPAAASIATNERMAFSAGLVTRRGVGELHRHSSPFASPLPANATLGWCGFCPPGACVCVSAAGLPGSSRLPSQDTLVDAITGAGPEHKEDEPGIFLAGAEDYSHDLSPAGGALPPSHSLQPVGQGLLVTSMPSLELPDARMTSPLPALPSAACPPYAVKASVGKRKEMEDAYALCPNIWELPLSPSQEVPIADKLPHRIALQSERSCWYLPTHLPPGANPVQDSDVFAGDRAAAGSSGVVGPVMGGLAAAEAQLGIEVEKLHFFAVYDGHGGVQASQHCAKRLHFHLSKALHAMLAGVETGLETGSHPASQHPAAADATLLELEHNSPFANSVVGAAAVGIRTAGSGSVPAPTTVRRESTGAPGTPALSGGGPDSVVGSSAEDGGGPPVMPGLWEADELGADADSASSGSTSETSKLEAALKQAFLATDEEFSLDGTSSMVGSTAVVALVGTRRIWIANCGEWAW